jgi:type VI secretion system secreted protein VgrG
VPAAYTQENRPMRITTPLGGNALLVASFSGTEGISRLFSFDVELLSENNNIDFSQIIGKAVTINLRLADGSDRYFHGLVSRFSQYAQKGGAAMHLSTYRATLVPWIWLLTRTTDSRIFQNMSVPEIVEKIFKENSFSDFSMEVQETHDKRVYCVQYRETDFSFISRLMEDEGIYFYFTHEQNKHTMVIADTPGKHKKIPGKVRYQFTFGNVEDDTITELGKAQEIQAGKYALYDYNFEMPKTKLDSSVESRQKVGPPGREFYDYPGGYAAKAAGDRVSRIRMEEEEARITTISGAGSYRAFNSGCRFTLSESVRTDMNDKEYVLTSIEHSATQGWEDGSDFFYTNRFTCIPHSTPFRPSRSTPKPLVHGSQTATVVGKDGEEIDTDKYGRVKVQFHWDREGQRNDKSSCWIRVSSSLAGGMFGSIFIPRIGQEAVVDFLEGDPDQPIITGMVYNAANMPPYPLPDKKTRNTIKTNSTKGGGGFNEIRFEDEKGKEQLFIHAESKQDNRVKGDSLEWVGKDRHLIVKKDQFEKVEGDQHLQVGGDKNEKVTGTVSLKTGQDLQVKVGVKCGVDAAQEIHLKGGMNVVIEAGMSVTLKAGGGFVVVGPAGVTISGTPVMINSGGSAGSGSGSNPNPPTDPKEADSGQPGQQETGGSSAPPTQAPPSAQAQTFTEGARSGTPF